MPPYTREYELLKLGISLSEQGRTSAVKLDWFLAIARIDG